MPVIFQKEMIRDGKPGISTMTFSLISFDAMNDMTKRVLSESKQEAKSFASIMHKATKPYILFRSDLYPSDVQATFEQIMNEYEGVDFEAVYLDIDTRWQPAKN